MCYHRTGRGHVKREEIATFGRDLMQISSSGLRNLTPLLFGSMGMLLFVFTPLQLARAQALASVYEEKKRQANDIAVNIVVSGLSCTCARFAEDMRNVLNDLRPDGLRILPVLDVGGLQKLNDVLCLQNIDLRVAYDDYIRFSHQPYPRFD